MSAVFLMLAAATAPALAQRTLDNGLKVAAREDHAWPLVSVALVFGAGEDDAEQPRIASLVSQAILGGSAEALDRIAASDESWTARDSIGVGLQCAPEKLDEALAILADAMLAADAGAPISASEAAPSSDSWFKALAQIVSARALPSPAVTNKEAGAFRAGWLRPENAALVISGDVRTEDALRAASLRFAAWTVAGASPVRRARALFLPRAPRLVVAEPSRAVTVRIDALLAAPAASDAELHMVEAIAARWRLQGQSAFLYPGREGSLLWVAVDTEPARLNAAIAAMIAPLKTPSALTKEISDHLLAETRESFSTNSSAARTLATGLVRGLALERIASPPPPDASQLQRVWRRWFSLSQAHLVVRAPREAGEAALRALKAGSVEIIPAK